MPEQRRPTPLGVAIPPKKPGDSLPPDERVRHEMLEATERLELKVDQVRAEMKATLQDFDERLVVVELATREAKDAATSARRTEEKVDKLTDHVLNAISVNADQNVNIAALKADVEKMAESSGTIAGSNAAASIVKKHGVRGGLVVIALSSLPYWGPLLMQACNAAPHDPKTIVEK